MVDPKEMAHRLMGVEETCKYCKFWTVEDQNDSELDVHEGECRRHAPVKPARKDEYGEFPVTHAGMWCGDFVLGKKRRKAGN